MPNRDQVLETLLDFADVVTSSVSSTLSNVLSKIVVQTDDDGTDETADNVEHYEHPAILHRPADATENASTGETEGMEVLVLRNGDEFVVVGGNEKRWKLSLEKGEVVVRAYGDTLCAIRLDPTNSVAYVQAPEVRIEETKDGTVDSIGLGGAIEAHFDSLKSIFDAHIHLTTATIGLGPAVGIIAPTATAAPSTPTLGSAKHKVEP